MADTRKPRRDVHLIVDADVLRGAKIECAKAEIDLSRATEELWRLWAAGKVSIQGIDSQGSTRKPKTR